MLATSKSSLPFSFVNGATAYSPYCIQLLYEHFRAGPFHQKLKKTLFSTPRPDSIVNMACDTKREIDHQDVTKSFRSASTMPSVMRRMCLVDRLGEVKNMRSMSKQKKDDDDDHLGWNVSSMDIRHIQPVVKMILQEGGLSTEERQLPFNVYSSRKCMLSSSILNKHTHDVARFLMMRYLSIEGLFGCTASDVPDIANLAGPQDLISKAKRSKGITIRRNGGRVVIPEMTERQTKEVTRQNILNKEIKRTKGLTSEMNACQALVKPDCSKYNVAKARGMQQALISHLGDILDSTTGKPDDLVQSLGLILTRQTSLPKDLSSTVTLATMEFAGAKFKGKI